MLATPSPSAGRAGRPGAPTLRAAARAASLALVLLAAACTTGTPEDPASSAPTATPTPAATSASASPAPAPSAPPSAPAPEPEPGPVPDAQPTGDRRDVSVVVTYSGWDAAASRVAVGAYAEDVVESGGTCTLTLTGAGGTRTASQPATPDAGSTACGELTVGAPSGTWSARVAYDSPASRGESAAVEVVVP